MKEVYIRLSSDIDAIAVTCCICWKMIDVEDLFEHGLQAHNIKFKSVTTD